MACLDAVAKDKKGKSDALRRFAEEAFNDFKVSEASEDFGLVRDIRNEVASHYSITAAKKNL